MKANVKTVAFVFCPSKETAMVIPYIDCRDCVTHFIDIPLFIFYYAIDYVVD